MTSPRKTNQGTPSKLPSPSKRSSPMKNSPIKGKVYTDVLHAASQPILSRNDSGLREIDVNVVPRPVTSAGPMEVGEKILGGAGHAHPYPVREFAKSVNSAGQPPYKRHAAETMTAKVPLKGEGGRTGRSKSKENNPLSASVGPGSGSRSGSLGRASHGRKLRSSPNQEV